MEQNNPVIQLPSNPKQNNFLITLLSILLLLSCIIAGFFAWQTQNLVNELRIMSDESKQTQIPTTTSTPDPTMGWKTYAIDKIGLSFKYPSDFIINEDTKSKPNFVTVSKNKTLITIYNPAIGNDAKLMLKEEIAIGEIKAIKDTYINGQVVISSNISENINWAIFYNVNKLDGSDLILIDQILSTFKFTGSEPVSCTMEAKLCPDGSSVGRIGPNCEFAKCPATSPQP